MIFSGCSNLSDLHPNVCSLYSAVGCKVCEFLCFSDESCLSRAPRVPQPKGGKGSWRGPLESSRGPLLLFTSYKSSGSWKGLDCFVIAITYGL